MHRQTADQRSVMSAVFLYVTEANGKYTIIICTIHQNKCLYALQTNPTKLYCIPIDGY